MDNIKEVVRDVLERLSSKQPADEQKIDDILRGALTESERKHVKFVGQKDDKCHFLVTSPVWLFQLNIKKNSILRKLKEIYPEIKTMHIRIGNFT